MDTTAKQSKLQHTPAYSWWVLLCSMICFMCFFIGLNGTAVFGPVIQEQYAITATDLSMLNTIGMLGFTIVPLLVAPLAVKTGIKKWVVICLGLNIVSGLLLLIPWCSNTYEGYAVTRFVQGAVGSMNGPLAAQLCLHFPKTQRGFATGIFMGFLGVGFSVTSFIAPRIFEMGFTWQMSILIMTCAVSIIGILFYTLGVKVFHNKYGSEYDSMDDLLPEAYESKRSTRFDNQPKAGQYKDLVKLRRIWAAGIFGATTAVIIYCLSYALPLYFTMDLGMDLVTASSVVAATFIWKLVASPAGGFLSDKVFHGERWQSNAIGTLLCGIVLLIMVFCGNGNIGLITVLTIVAFFFGSFYGGTYWTWNFEMSTPEFAPITASYFVTTGNIGAVIGVPVCGMLIDATGTGVSAMIFIAVVAILAVIPAYLAKN